MTERRTKAHTKRLSVVRMGIIVCTMLLAACAAAGKEGADTVYRNGKIYTVDAAGNVAQAIAIKDGLIVAVGSDSAIEEHIGDKTRVVDLAGRMVMPGLIDAHMHPAGGGALLTACSLQYQAWTIDEILSHISVCLEERKGTQNPDWLRVVAWFRQATKPEGADLSAAVLDRLDTDRPIAVVANDFHTVAANSAAMKAAGITRDTPDPSGGRIVRDEQGNPTGIFLDAAMGLVLGAEPQVSPEEQKVSTLANVKAVLKAVNAQGVTAIFDAGSDEGALAAFATLHQAKELTVRGVFSIVVSPDEARDPAAAVASLRRTASTYGRAGTAVIPGITIDRAKMFVDGVVQAPAQTAALIQPYLHNVGTTGQPKWVPSGKSGELYYDQEMVTGMLDALVTNGMSAHLHTDGDEAVRITLNAIEAIRRRHKVPAFRPGLAHNELVAPVDYARFAELDAIPVLSLQWGKPAPDTIESVKPYIGPERFPFLETAGKFERAGARVAFGSDWPVDALDEWRAMQIGVTRENPSPLKPTYRGRLGDDPGLDIAAAIRAFTINAAYSLNLEQHIGSLEPGKYADLIVIDRDLTAIPANQIAGTEVLLTVIGGKEVYRAPGFR